MIQSIVNLSGVSSSIHIAYPQSCCPSCVPYIHEDSTAAVRAYGKLSDKFSVTSGVRQGCVLAPTLFNFYFDVAIRMALEEHHQQGSGIRVAYLLDADLVGNRRIPKLETLVTDLEYADDMALLANNWSDLTAMLDSLTTCCKKLGLTISCMKTKSLAVLPPDDPATESPVPIHLVPEGEPIEVVSHFQYLGSIVQDDCGMDTEINSRICKASSAFQSLSRILWHQRKIQTRTKVRVLNSVILPTLSCCMVWRALSSLSLLCTALSPLWSVVCGSSWNFSQAEEATHHHTQDGQAAEDFIHHHSAPSAFPQTPIQDVRGQATKAASCVCPC